jgi:protein ImuB
VTVLHDGRRRVIAALDPMAAALGLKDGMAVTQALTVVPGLQVIEADPDADAAALLRLAHWCHRITPLASVDSPDGVWLDITGCAHLWGGEAALLQMLLGRLDRDGLHARAAAADTPGAAYALARYGDQRSSVIPPGQHGTAITSLPVAALRLAPELAGTLRRLGFEQIGHLSRIPRALLARRFGLMPGLRLDQAHGCVQETLKPLRAEHILQRRTAFIEPLLTADALATATSHLVNPFCEEMEQMGLGARQLDLLFERVDGHAIGIRIGTARPSRDAGHLTRLLNERLETVDPGLGIEAMLLMAPMVERLHWEQQEGDPGLQENGYAIASLMDRLTNRLGKERLYRAVPLESETPERSINRNSLDSIPRVPAPILAPKANQPEAPAASMRPAVFNVIVSQQLEPTARIKKPGCLHLVETATADIGELLIDPPAMAWKRPWALRRLPHTSVPAVPWPGRLHAPSRLLEPPRRVDAIAALPNHPPVAFTWRHHRHRVCRAEGPERIHGEWWFKDRERQSVRDYFRVEDENGQRFWLFREGNGVDACTGDLSWYLHGLF